MLQRLCIFYWASVLVFSSPSPSFPSHSTVGGNLLLLAVTPSIAVWTAKKHVDRLCTNIQVRAYFLLIFIFSLFICKSVLVLVCFRESGIAVQIYLFTVVILLLMFTLCYFIVCTHLNHYIKWSILLFLTEGCIFQVILMKSLLNLLWCKVIQSHSYLYLFSL